MSNEKAKMIEGVRMRCGCGLCLRIITTSFDLSHGSSFGHLNYEK